MARTEVLEISLPALRADRQLCQQILKAFADFSVADDDPSVPARAEPKVLAAAEKEIATGIVDAVNLLVMDMDLCVRCGNCSLACHKVHGQSRLLRRGIHIERPQQIGAKAAQHVLAPSVCMHCKDPECLTGCPTGAIFRDPKGQVDINTHTCIGCFDCAGKDGVAIVDVKLPEKPRLDQMYNAAGKLDDTRQVKIAMTNASLFAYVADGKNGLRIVQLTSPETMATYAGFSPRPQPQLIATFKTKGEALAVSKALDRDRAVDESGNQIAVFGRRGARPFTFAETQRTLRTNQGQGSLFTVTDEPTTEPRNPKAAKLSRSSALIAGLLGLLLAVAGWRMRGGGIA